MASYRRCKCGCGGLIKSEDRRWYCNHACRSRAYRNRHAFEHRNSRPQYPPKHCAFCDAEFMPRQHNQRCCKPAHKQALYRELKALRKQHDLVA